MKSNKIEISIKSPFISILNGSTDFYELRCLSKKGNLASEPLFFLCVACPEPFTVKTTFLC